MLFFIPTPPSLAPTPFPQPALLSLILIGKWKHVFLVPITPTPDNYFMFVYMYYCFQVLIHEQSKLSHVHRMSLEIGFKNICSSFLIGRERRNSCVRITLKLQCFFLLLDGGNLMIVKHT